MKVVTGGAGFIGSNLVASLERKGYEVAVCDWFDDPKKKRNLEKRNLKHFVHPENLFNFLNQYSDQIEVIFLLGAISSTTETNVKLINNINTELPTKIWQWCQQNNTRLIYASSAATYGDGAFGFNDFETSGELGRLLPLNAYGRSKNNFDIWVAQQSELGNQAPPQWVGLKFFNVYGPNEYHKGNQMSVIPQLYTQIVTTGTADLFKSHNPEYSDGGQLRDFIWVGDCVNVMLWLDANHSVSGIFNCGVGEARSFLDLARIIFKAMNQKVSISYKPTPINIRDKYQYFTEANMEKLKSSGYTENFTSLEEGVTRYVKNYLMVKDSYI